MFLRGPHVHLNLHLPWLTGLPFLFLPSSAWPILGQCKGTGVERGNIFWGFLLPPAVLALTLGARSLKWTRATLGGHPGGRHGVRGRDTNSGRAEPGGPAASPTGDRHDRRQEARPASGQPGALHAGVHCRSLVLRQLSSEPRVARVLRRRSSFPAMLTVWIFPPDP